VSELEKNDDDDDTDDGLVINDDGMRTNADEVAELTNAVPDRRSKQISRNWPSLTSISNKPLKPSSQPADRIKPMTMKAKRGSKMETVRGGRLGSVVEEVREDKVVEAEIELMLAIEKPFENLQ